MSGSEDGTARVWHGPLEHIPPAAAAADGGDGDGGAAAAGRVAVVLQHRGFVTGVERCGE